MGSLFAYSLNSSILLAAMYLAYKWAMASERQHAFNRLALWSIYIVSLIAPAVGLVHIVPEPVQPVGTVVVDVSYFEPVVAVDESVVSLPSQPWWLTAMLWTYLAGMLAVVAHTLMVAVRLAMVVRGGERVLVADRTVILIDDDRIAPFSVMNSIVMSRRDFREAGEMIFVHERCHVRLRHWADLLMAQAVAVVQWYNPASWLMREELRAVHEYQADAGVMSSGVNVKEYQMLLIKKAVGSRFPSLANSLNHSKLKKRITMMCCQPASRARRARAFALLPALGVALFVTGLPAVADVLDDTAETSLTVEDETTEAVTVDSGYDDGSDVGIADGEIAVEPTVAAVPTVTEEPVADVADEPEMAEGWSADDPDTADADVVVIGAIGRKPARNDDKPAEPMNTIVNTSNTSFPAADGRVQNDDENALVNEELSDVFVIGAINKDIEEERVPKQVVGENKSNNKVELDSYPKYPGGEADLTRFISEHVRYPQDAMREGKHGRVVVRFVVGKNGKLSSPKVVNSVSPSLDAEALRVVSLLEDFEPAMANGKPVSVHYTLPIQFNLKKYEVNKEALKHVTVKQMSISTHQYYGNSKADDTGKVRTFVDGVEVQSIRDVDSERIKDIKTVNDAPRYPNGAVYITLKSAE